MIFKMDHGPLFKFWDVGKKAYLESFRSLWSTQDPATYSPDCLYVAPYEISRWSD